MPITGNRVWLPLLSLALALSGCGSVPGGASTSSDEGATYAVEAPATQLDFSVAASSQSNGSVTATLATQDMHPALFYRYQVQSRVNGNYVMMPNPPTVYVIRKLPFYQTEPDKVSVRIDLQSSSGSPVMRSSQAVCSFDVNGKTVQSTPLDAADLLPGHSLSVEVQGPALDQFQDRPTGTLTVWLYGLGADKNQVFRWDISYSLKQQMRQPQGEILGQTTSADEAKSYEERVDRAPAGDPGASPGG